MAKQRRSDSLSLPLTHSQMFKTFVWAKGHLKKCRYSGFGPPSDTESKINKYKIYKIKRIVSHWEWLKASADSDVVHSTFSDESEQHAGCLIKLRLLEKQRAALLNIPQRRLWMLLRVQETKQIGPSNLFLNENIKIIAQFVQKNFGELPETLHSGSFFYKCLLNTDYCRNYCRKLVNFVEINF